MRIKITPIGNKASLNTKAWEDAWRDLTLSTADYVDDLFKQSFQGFHNHSPSTSRRQSGAGASKEVVVGVLEGTPDNTIYSYVNWGTRPRIIQARNPDGGLVLRFRARYAPATARGRLGGGQWVKSGPWQVKFEVRHPGISARRFDEVIQMLAKEYIEKESGKTLRSLRGKSWRKR